jgi:hypothetical protein
MGVATKTVTGSVGVAVVALAVAGTAIGWRDVGGWLTERWPIVWDHVTGWWTPGWGNLFTVAIATAALGVGAWFNYRTLSRADERHNHGRVDARHDKLRSEVAALLSATGQRRSQMEIFADRIHDLIAAAKDQERLMVAVKAALNESVVALYAQVDGRAYAVRMLTDDEYLLARVSEIQDVLAEDIAAYEAVLGPDPETRNAEALGNAQTRRDARNILLVRATEQLLAHCSRKFAVLTV